MFTFAYDYKLLCIFKEAWFAAEQFIVIVFVEKWHCHIASFYCGKM